MKIQNAGLFFIAMSLSLNAYAEYYVAYGVPVAFVACDNCYTSRVVSAPYHAHRTTTYYKSTNYRDYKYERATPVRARANSYSIAVYPVVLMGPAYSCSVWMPTPCHSCQTGRECGNPKSADYYTSTYVGGTGGNELYISNNDDDRATADDIPADMNIDY